MNLLKSSRKQKSLLARVQAGDAAATEIFAGKIGELARRYFCRAGLKDDAEDLAWKCARVAIWRLGLFDGANFRGWIYTVMLNLVRDYARANKRQIQTVPLLECDGEIAGGEPSHNGVLTREQHEALDSALAQLTPKEREFIQAQAGDERVPHEVMAHEFGISTAAARVRYHRAHKKLKAFLQADPRMQAWIAGH